MSQPTELNRLRVLVDAGIALSSELSLVLTTGIDAETHAAIGDLPRGCACWAP